MKISIEQRHIDAGIRLNTADPFALAIKEKLERFYNDPSYKQQHLDQHKCLRVELVVGVSSSVLVTAHFIVWRKNREEVVLGFQRYHFGPKPEFNLHDTAFDWMVAYGNGQFVKPTTIEITLESEIPPWGI